MKNRRWLWKEIKWGEIQQRFNDGMSTKEIKKEYGLNGYQIKVAARNGLFKRPKPSELSLLPKVKAKISSSMKRAHAEGRHPGWLAVNLNKDNRTYPEEYFLKIIEKDTYFKDLIVLEKIQFKEYVFDFVIVDFKIDIEIDGGHHYVDLKTIEKDKKRDDVASKYGWNVIRLPWINLSKDPVNTLIFLKKKIDEIKLTSTHRYDISSLKIERYNQSGFGNGKIYHAVRYKISRVDKRKYGNMSNYNAVRKNNYIPMLKTRKVLVRPSLAELEKDIQLLGFCGTGRKYGVSDVAIRKWILYMNRSNVE